MTSAFLRIEGNTVKNRLWSFLIIHSEFDYSMRDIAKFSKISYSSLKAVWKDFIKRKIVLHTRDVGNAKMYTLNRNNPSVEKFIEYYWTVVESAAQKEVDANADTQEAFVHARSSAKAMTMSAKTF